MLDVSRNILHFFSQNENYSFSLLVETLIPHVPQLFAFDTVNKQLSPTPGEEPKIPIPSSLVAGACAGVSSTLLTYPLELVKTRLTIEVRNNLKFVIQAHKNVFSVIPKIC